jgi:hypothetical protein
MTADGKWVWRRGRWEKQYNKIEKREVITFCFYGPGYFDHALTAVAVDEKEFGEKS